jgi:hypothetical protein
MADQVRKRRDPLAELRMLSARRSNLAADRTRVINRLRGRWASVFLRWKGH